VPDLPPITPFAGVPPPPEDQARAAIIPVPLEATVSYRPGTALGPAAIMAASAHMELYDELLDEEPVTRGILTRPAVDTRGTVAEVLARVQAVVAAELESGRLPLVVGGEHTVTLGALKALVENRGTDFAVVSLDAHLDLRHSYQGRRLSHACVMRRAVELGLRVHHLGVRSCSRAEARALEELGLHPLWDHQRRGDPQWLEHFLERLGQVPVYLSLDVDVLEPGLMPATGTPEPGGLDWHQVSEVLAALCARLPVVGLDLVELAPLPGLAAPDFTAARLLYRALGLALRGPDRRRNAPHRRRAERDDP